MYVLFIHQYVHLKLVHGRIERGLPNDRLLHQLGPQMLAHCFSELNVRGPSGANGGSFPFPPCVRFQCRVPVARAEWCGQLLTSRMRILIRVFALQSECGEWVWRAGIGIQVRGFRILHDERFLFPCFPMQLTRIEVEWIMLIAVCLLQLWCGGEVAD